MGVRLVVLVCCAALLGGCTTQAPPPAPQQSKPAIPKPERPAPDPVESLLMQAENAFRFDRLTTPVDDNAYLHYSTALSLDPGNAEARRGLERIVETYLSWTLRAIEARQFRRATQFLRKAQSIDEFHPSIPALQTRIEKARSSRIETVRLDSASLYNRSSVLVRQLHELGRQSEAAAARVRIIARSDADGRWIYQQLNEASENRIRATIELGAPARIQLTYP